MFRTYLKENYGLQEFKIVFLLFKHAKEILTLENKAGAKIETFEDLKENYKCIKPLMTEESLNVLNMQDDEFKKAEIWLVHQLHQSKQITLYNKLYEQAENGDIRSIVEFFKFSNSLFEKSESEIEEEMFFKNFRED